MPGRIRQEDIAAVRERSPIADVVGEYLQLRPAGGGSLKGLCPFHDEKTPSFNVTPGKELYYCFSCTAGGDVIKFVQEIEHLSFAEAIERLAARAGVELRYEQGGYVPGQETSQRRRLIDAHRAAVDFYSERIRGDSASAARAFLAERGFELSDAERFGVGYSPAAWDELTRHLRGRGFTDEELLKSGLARQGRRGLIDMFRGRLMWPVRDLTGETIAFGARKLDPDDDGPKYLNTPETALFKKGHVLYGADLAKREIAHRRQAVIVEGYTDVMACHLSGVPTAVATCGTSFGEDHVKVLRRLIMDTNGSDGEVIFTFDGDAAGQRAADGQQGRPYDRSDPVLRVEREALKLAVQWPALCGPEFDALGMDALSFPVHAAVAGLIAGCGGVISAGRARDWVAALIEAAPDDRARAFVTELAVEPLQVAGEPDEKYADMVLATVGELASRREIAAIKAKLQRTNPEDDQPAYNKMFGDLVALEQRRKWLLGRATGG